MRLRDLKIGGASAWPPEFGGPYVGAEKLSSSDDATLKEVRLNPDGCTILLVFEEKGKRFTGDLYWDEPPSPTSVLEVLTNALGEPLRDLHDLEV